MQREGGTPTAIESESFMSKRQQQLNRKHGDRDTKPGETARPVEDPETPNIMRQFILTQSADDTLHEAIRLLSRATGTSPTNSHFLRALLKIVANAIPEIEREAEEIGKLKLPKNARENQQERDEYEQKLAEAIASAVCTCPPIGLDKRASRKGKDSGK
jgi:hypothetical protein